MSSPTNIAENRAWPRWGYAPPLALWLVLGVVLVNTAWLCDDAFISFRVSDNLIHGYGLRWNTADRVQVFTNPLWTLFIAGVYAITREMFYTPMAVSLILSLLTAGLAAFAAARDWRKGVTALALLLFSRAFLDYSSSGLENPLSHLLLAIFFVLPAAATPRKLFAVSLTAGLILTNRMDLGALIAFPLAAQWIMCAWPRAPRSNPLGRSAAHAALLLGLSPFLCWELFAVIYYGFPFPNTAYAKLGAGIPRAISLSNGFWYLLNSLRGDYVTIPAMAMAVALALFTPSRRRAAALGILFYMAYIVWAGGDFMGGRFLAAPFLCAVLILAENPYPASGGARAALLAAVACAGLLNPAHPLRTGPEKGEGFTALAQYADAHGIADERRYYCRDTALRHALTGEPVLQNDWARLGRELRPAGPMYLEFGNAGFLGFFAGPQLHVIDTAALGDAFLARLPALYDPLPRPGHMTRYVPPGYAAALAGKPEKLTDPNLRAFFEEMNHIIRGPLWDGARWRAILRMNLPGYAPGIDQDAYRFPEMTHLSLTDAESAHGPWTFTPRGIEIRFESPRPVAKITFLVTPSRPCDVLLISGGDIAWKATVAKPDDMPGITLPHVSCGAIRIIPWPNIPWRPLPRVTPDAAYTLRLFKCE